MNKLDYLMNEAENLGTDARRAALSRMLKAEENRLEKEMIPLDADHSQAIHELRQERCLQAIGAAVAAGAIALTVFIVKKVNAGIEKKAAVEKAKLEKERKEMIQKLARIKGRA